MLDQDENTRSCGLSSFRSPDFSLPGSEVNGTFPVILKRARPCSQTTLFLSAASNISSLHLADAINPTLFAFNDSCCRLVPGLTES